MRSIPLNKVWGLGKSAIAKLNSLNIFSVDDVLSIEKLETMFTPCFARFLYEAVRGMADGVFKKREKIKSISTEHTFEFDENDFVLFDNLFFKQSTEIVNRLIKKNLIAKTVFIKITYANFSKKIASETGSKIISIKDLYERVKKIFLKTYNGENLSNIENANFQDDLFVLDRDLKLSCIERTIAGLDDKSIKPARLLKLQDD